MSFPTTSNQTQIERAFRRLAVARGRSIAQEPDADSAYECAQRLTQQALHDSRSGIDKELAIQLHNIVITDRRRHQRVADAADFPAAFEM